jgi:hypothetical protein
MTAERTTYTDADLDSLSWHDNHIHGLRLSEGEHGAGELELDVDHIVEWLCPENEPWCFRVAPATLTFHNVFGLRMSVDYVAVTAGLVPPSIDDMQFERKSHPTGFISYDCTIRLNWPEGAFTFSCSGFTLRLRRPATVVDHQCLEPAERA